MPGHVDLMQRALREAARARGRTRPNPMVGCVIARDGKILGVGYHQRAGAPHAELEALRAAGEGARGADAYVTLEPCDHHGRTGPCTGALIAAGIQRVFVGMRDPNPLVNGKGLRRLRRAGITVELGLLSDDCQRLNEAYSCYISCGRPFVVAKIAQSLDGRVATRTGASQWISGEQARDIGHRLRNELDAIIVGRGTVVADDPKLTCRYPDGRDPVRVILDSKARTPLGSRVVKLARSSAAPTWIAVGRDAPARRRTALDRAGVETFGCKLSRGHIDIEDLLVKLGERELLSVLVEGGPSVLGSFFDASRVDKVSITLAPMIIGGERARSSVGAIGASTLADAVRLVDLEVVPSGEDLVISAYVQRVRARAKK